MTNTWTNSVPSGSPVALPTNGAETVVMTLAPAVALNNPGGSVSIDGVVYLTPGTGSTSATVRVRQGSLTGPVVMASPALTVVAAAPIALAVDAQDTSAAAQSSTALQYVVTVQTAGTSAAGSAYGTVSVTSATSAS